jgi:TATA-binding protein-associated factor Taf7
MGTPMPYESVGGEDEEEEEVMIEDEVEEEEEVTSGDDDERGQMKLQKDILKEEVEELEVKSVEKKAQVETAANPIIK